MLLPIPVRGRPIIRTDLQIRRWEGGFQMFGFPVKKKSVHPEILFLFIISLNLFLFLNELFVHAL